MRAASVEPLSLLMTVERIGVIRSRPPHIARALALPARSRSEATVRICRTGVFRAIVFISVFSAWCGFVRTIIFADGTLVDV